jgi:hypothetical protein
MERFFWLLNELFKQFKSIEEGLQALFAKIPSIGNFASDNSNLITLAIMILVTIFVIKPLVKWSIGVIALGVTMAGAISYFTGMTFWGVLPLTALAASIVMFSNKFTMG